MNTKEKISLILEGFADRFENDPETAAYYREKWPELKELFHTLWKETGHEGKTDLSFLDDMDEESDVFATNILGDIDLSLLNEKLWQERKQFNEDLLNEFTDSKDDLTHRNHHLAIAECVKELEGYDQAMAYVDRWQKEDPDPEFQDGVRISLAFFDGRYDEAKAIADRHADLPQDEMTEDRYLLSMMQNVYSELQDRARLLKVNEREKELNERSIESLKAEMKEIYEAYLRLGVIEDRPEGIRDVFNQLCELFSDEDAVYRLMAEDFSEVREKRGNPLMSDAGFQKEMLDSFRWMARSFSALRSVRDTGSCEKLEDLLTIQTAERVREESGIKNVSTEELPAAAARRLLSPGAMRNVFITMHDDVFSIFKRVLDHPEEKLEEEEQFLLFRELGLYCLIFDDGRTVLTKDFREQFSKLYTPAFEQQRRLYSWVLDCLFAADKYYGVLKDTEFLKMVSLNGTKISIREVKKIWQSLPADLRYCRFEGGYVFDADWAKGKEYQRQFSAIRKEYPPDLPAAGEIDGLYVHGWPVREPVWSKMKDYLKSLCNDAAAVEKLMTGLFAAICSGNGIQEILHIFDEEREVQEKMDPAEIAQLITDLINNTRSWEAAGHKPDELSRKKNALLRN